MISLLLNYRFHYTNGNIESITHEFLEVVLVINSILIKIRNG